MRYLTISELVYINGKVLNNQQFISGKQQIRDMALRTAGARSPAASAFGEDAYPMLSQKVAALFHSVARNHPFTDGNKRTATVAAIFMFQVNGQRVAWEPEEALDVILSVAEGRRAMNSIAAWFPLEPTAESLEENAEKAMIAIARIIEEHRWLLDELANR